MPSLESNADRLAEAPTNLLSLGERRKSEKQCRNGERLKRECGAAKQDGEEAEDLK